MEDDSYCVDCGKLIILGDFDYMEYDEDGNPVCEDCQMNYVQCYGCGAMVKMEKAIHYDGKWHYYCDKCHEKYHDHCISCGGDVYRTSETPHDANGGYICDKCFKEKYEHTRCHKCGCAIPLGELHETNGNWKLCKSCYDKRHTICHDCGKIIDKEWYKYYVIDGETYCEYCASKFPREKYMVDGIKVPYMFVHFDEGQDRYFLIEKRTLILRSLDEYEYVRDVVKKLQKETGIYPIAAVVCDIENLIPVWMISGGDYTTYLPKEPKYILQLANLMGYKASLIYRKRYVGMFMKKNLDNPNIKKYYIYKGTQSNMYAQQFPSPLVVGKDDAIIKDLIEDERKYGKVFSQICEGWITVGDSPTEDMSKVRLEHTFDSNQNGYAAYEYLLFYKKLKEA